MPTLPDGGTVSLRQSELWDISFPSPGLVYSEGWDTKLLQMGTFVLDDVVDSVEPGQVVSFSGTALRADGLPAEVDVVVELPDGTTETVTASVDKTGSFTASFVAEQPGLHSARGQNDVAGLRQSEPWDIESPPAGSQIIVEGWEE